MTFPDKNKYGLTARDMQTLLNVFAKYPEVKNVVIFGSRAKGTFTAGSDIDLAIMDRLSNETLLWEIKQDLEESTLPYFVDLVGYHFLQDSKFKEHIDRVGMPLVEDEI